MSGLRLPSLFGGNVTPAAPPTTLRVAIVNTVPASHSPLAAQLTPAYLARVAAALQIQLQRDVAPYWPYAEGAQVRAGGDPPATGETIATIVPTDADAPGAEAFHANTATGQPDEFLMLDTCNTPADATTGMSHENAEIAGDPECNLWRKVPAGLPSYPEGVAAGQQIAQEIADPVQDRSYPVDLGDGQPPIMVSDFCLPAYFDTTIAGPTTYCEKNGTAPRVDPFQRSPGGYHLVRNADGSGEVQAFGKCAKADRIRAGKHHKGSRPHRRGAKRA